MTFGIGGKGFWMVAARWALVLALVLLPLARPLPATAGDESGFPICRAHALDEQPMDGAAHGCCVLCHAVHIGAPPPGVASYGTVAAARLTVPRTIGSQRPDGHPPWRSRAPPPSAAPYR